MKPKTAQLQIRVTARQKAGIQRLAKRAGMDMSSYVLNRVLVSPAARFTDCVDACSDPEKARDALAELNSLLTGFSAAELQDAISVAPVLPADPYCANYIAAMVEYACYRQGVEVPRWSGTVAALSEPAFASTLQSLRLHLLMHSPPPFRRRNIYIDSSLGDRV